MDPAPPLSCTVRECGLWLEPRAGQFVCARGHAYDVARRGYVNLLQPQDRRSSAAGDSRAAVEARARLLARGIGRTVVDHLVARAARAAPPGATVADVGSGSGEFLAWLGRQTPCTCVGIDLSVAAAEHAARHFPQVTWVVANADRRIPLLDHSVDVLVSLHGRRHPRDAARVLTRRGTLLMAVPAPDDLVELREAVQGRGVSRDRAAGLIEEHEPHFEIEDRVEVRERHVLDHEALVDLLLGTYRGARPRAASRAGALEALEVTLASTVVEFRKR